MAPSSKLLIHLCTICIIVGARQVLGGTEPWRKSEKSAERGSKVELPCILISAQCGGLHSIKWYHGNTRICIFSQSVGLTRENNDLGSRIMLNYDDNSNKTYLEIPEVKLDDQGLYRCEATYFSVNSECNNVQHIILNVYVRPDYVRVTEKDWKTNLTSGDSLGPFNEGTEISLKCDTGEGKPVPTVEWYNGDKLLKGDSSDSSDREIGPGSNELTMTLGRTELGATLTCRVSSSALDKPLTVDVKLDVHVSPEKMDVKGVVGHVVSGTKILLQCIVSAARPPANVTWYNGTELLLPGNERLEMFPTKTDTNENSPDTSDTISHLAFTATEYDNGRDFSCHAENSVTKGAHLKPMKEVTTIEVLYPPIVTLRQENITVNETDNIHLFCDYVANPAELTAVTWKLNDEILGVVQNDHYEGGVPGDETLIVKNSSANDMGSYRCVLNNSIGESVNQDVIDVSVLYKPKVKVTMEPEAPVNEADRLNVSLTCEVVDGNPMTLNTVRWFLDGDLLKELPDCARNSSAIDTGAMAYVNDTVNVNLADEISTFCDIDPSKLLLEAVGRSFNGNYACEGRNDAGWGERSDSAPVVVYYKPGPASISYEPKRVVKKGSLNISCSVNDLGRPEVTGFKWFRGTHQIVGEEKSVLRIDSVNLQTKANFTCMAYNEAGDGDPATVFIDVAARPAFIKSLNGYAGFARNSTNVSIECWVECSPICNISWSRDGVMMDTDTTEIFRTNVYHPPDHSKDDFESVQSTLVWNMTAWPDGLEPFRDNKNFTCESTGNGIGPGVKSETVFRVEFPPQNMTISKKIIDVVVDSIPDNVNCTAVAEPEPMFRWFREGSNDVISTDAVHVFKTKVPKRSNGTYICQAYNRHGARNITTNLNVLFKPECRIDEERIDGEYYLVCSASANPKESDFTWSLKSDNDTLDQIGEIRDGRGYLRLDTSITNFRTYLCVANNSIGPSLPCERGVPGNFPWWLQLEGDVLIIVIIITVVMLLAIVICCIVIWCICRRKRAQAKYSNRVVELEEREHPDGGPPSPTESSRSRDDGVPRTSLHPTPAPRWPLKPGVLVHVNRAHSLGTNRLAGSSRANDTLRIHTNSGLYANDRYRSRPSPTIVRAPVRPFRRGANVGNCGNLASNKDNANQRALSAVSILHDEGMIARANRIRAMFGAQLKEPDAFPGISRDKTAVTYKRIAPAHQRRVLHMDAPTLPDRASSLGAIVCRKRKKPGADPGQGTNNNHVDSVSETLPEPEGKTFYENLPFHGIQTPPNKLVTSPKFARVSALHGNTESITVVNGTNAISSITVDPTVASTVVGPKISNVTTTKTTNPNKTKTTTTTTSPSHSAATSSCSSLPANPSEPASLCGASSGYESATARSSSSHLGPHYSSNNMPRNNSPEPKYNTLKPLRRRKHKQAHSRFYSLRLCGKHAKTGMIGNSGIATTNSSRRGYQLYAIPIVKKCPHGSSKNNVINGSDSTIATTLRSTPDLTPNSSLSRSTKTTTPLPTPPSTPTIARRIADPENNVDDTVVQDNCPNDFSTPPIPAPRIKKTDPSRHTYQNVPPPVFPTRNKIDETPSLTNDGINDIENGNFERHDNADSAVTASGLSPSLLPILRSNNLYNYQEYYQQHQKQQHYQLQHHHQEMQHYGSYTTPGSGLPSSSLSQLTLPLTRSLYHSSVVSPLETSFMPVHNHTSATRQPHGAHHQQQQQQQHQQQHHQFSTSTLYPHHRSEDNRTLGGVGGGGGVVDNNITNNSPPLSLIHGNSDLELSNYVLDHQLQQSSRRSSSNQQLQQHGGRRNDRRKYTRKQHGDRSSADRKSKHRRSIDNRVRGGDSGIVSDTSDLLASICSGTALPITGSTLTNIPGSRRPTIGDATTTSSMTFNQYRQDLGIPENYKITYPHYYEDAIDPCPRDYSQSDPMTNGTIGNENSHDLVNHPNRDRQINRYASSGHVSKISEPNLGITNNPTISGSANVHYSEIGNNHVKVTGKSKRSTSGYGRANDSQTTIAGQPVTTVSTIPIVATTNSVDDKTIAASSVNGSSLTATAATLSVAATNPTTAHYTELHFRDVGQEIDV